MVNQSSLTKIVEQQKFVETANINGIKPLLNLFEEAKKTNVQSIVVRKFLLSCYDGSRFPFNITEFRSLSFDIWQDCMTVLAMDWSPTKEVHEYLDSSSYSDLVNGGAVFESWASALDNEYKDTLLFVMKNSVNHILEDIETHILYGQDFNYEKDFNQIKSLVENLKSQLSRL